MKRETRVAVIGAGLGGATAGALLQREGFEVRLYEQARSFVSKVQRISAENTFLRDPTDPTWVYGYDAVTEPLGVQQ